jgi:hypothetical protein
MAKKNIDAMISGHQRRLEEFGVAEVFEDRSVISVPRQSQDYMEFIPCSMVTASISLRLICGRGRGLTNRDCGKRAVKRVQLTQEAIVRPDPNRAQLAKNPADASYTYETAGRAARMTAMAAGASIPRACMRYAATTVALRPDAAT